MPPLNSSHSANAAKTIASAGSPPEEEETTLDAIFNNMGGEGKPNDTELHTTDETDGDGNILADGEVENEEEEKEEEKKGATPEPTEEPPEHVAAARLRQYETTLIPSLQRENERIARDLEAERSRLKAYETYQNDFSTHGLTPDEASIGLKMAAGYKLNPAKFIENLISNARAQGVTLAPTVPQGNVDAATIATLVKQQVEAALRPISSRVQEQTAEEERAKELRTQVNTFYTQFPDAPMHENEIAYAMREHGLPLERAYYEVKLWAMQNGYDWTKPLRPQIESKTTTRTPNGPSPGNRRNGNSNTARAVSPPANPEVDWKTLVHQSVSEVMTDG